MNRTARATLTAAAMLGLILGALPACMGADGLTRASLLKEAWGLVELVPFDLRTLLMADIAVALAPIDEADARLKFSEAEHTAISIPVLLESTIALQAVARRAWPIDPTLAQLVLAKAIRRADELEFPGERVLIYTLIGLTQAEFAPEDAPRSLALATENAHAMVKAEEAYRAAAEGTADEPVSAEDAQRALALAEAEVAHRIAALRDVSRAYTDIDPEQAQLLFDEALTLAGTIQDPIQRDLTLADLAGLIAKRSLQQAIGVAATITDSAAKSQALRVVALQIPPADAAMALELARSIPDAPARVSTLTDIALGGAPAEAAAQAAEDATQIAAKMEHDDTGFEARVLAATAWAATDADRALAEAKKIDDEYYTANAYGAIATYLAEPDTDRALKVLERIERGIVRSAPLRAIVGALAEDNPAQAYDLAKQIRSRRFRAEAFVTIAISLPESDAGEG